MAAITAHNSERENVSPSTCQTRVKSLAAGCSVTSHRKVERALLRQQRPNLCKHAPAHDNSELLLVRNNDKEIARAPCIAGPSCSSSSSPSLSPRADLLSRTTSLCPFVALQDRFSCTEQPRRGDTIRARLGLGPNSDLTRWQTLSHDYWSACDESLEVHRASSLAAAVSAEPRVRQIEAVLSSQRYL